MKDIAKLTLLIDFYGCLLTQKQYSYIYDYYFLDLTLLEIGEKYNISKNAIHDSIKKSIIELEQYDSKLKLIESYNLRKKIYNELNLDKNILDKLLKTEVLNHGQKHK